MREGDGEEQRHRGEQEGGVDQPPVGCRPPPPEREVRVEGDAEERQDAELRPPASGRNRKYRSDDDQQEDVDRRRCAVGEGDHERHHHAGDGGEGGQHATPGRGRHRHAEARRRREEQERRACSDQPIEAVRGPGAEVEGADAARGEHLGQNPIALRPSRPLTGREQGEAGDDAEGDSDRRGRAEPALVPAELEEQADRDHQHDHAGDREPATAEQHLERGAAGRTRTLPGRCGELSRRGTWFGRGLRRERRDGGRRDRLAGDHHGRWLHRLGQCLWGRRRDCERRWSRLRGGGAFATLSGALERTLERGEASKDLAREAVAHQHDHEHRHGEQSEQDEPGGEHQAGHLVAMAQGRHHDSEQGAEQARDDDACDHEGAASPARTGARGGHAPPV